MKREQIVTKRARTKAAYVIQEKSGDGWTDVPANFDPFRDTGDAKRHIRDTPELHGKLLRVVAVKYEGTPQVMQREPVLKF